MTILDQFLVAATVPVGQSHASGDLAEASGILASAPDIATRSINAAAVLGDDEGIRRHLAADPSAATARGGPHGWDPLTYLCFSRYLRLDASRSAGFVRTAEALLGAGASAMSGWMSESDGEWESVLYGAAGLAHHEGVTRVLLAHGAEVNDVEVTYHAPESREPGAMRALLETGRLTADSLATMLARKADIHDLGGMRMLLERGADANRVTRWGFTPLQHSVKRDNGAEIVALLLEHGADPGSGTARFPLSAAALAARRGRADVIALLRERGVTAADHGADPLLVACVLGETATARSGDETALERLRADGGSLLAEFAGNGNTAGVACLLDLGIPVDARYAAGDAYFDVAPGSTALHVAAWRARHDTVRLLLDRGADPGARDARGRTPLTLAVKAGVDSYWTEGRRPDSVAALLAAGAGAADAAHPTGWPEADALLAADR